MKPVEWRDIISGQRSRLKTLRQHWNNESPAGWLSKQSRDALDGKLSRVSVNFPRLVVQSISDRLTLRGFRERGSSDLDNKFTQLMGTVNLSALQEHIHVDYLLYGAAYGTTWTADNGQPIFIADSPMTAAAIADPATGETIEGVRSWRGRDGAYWLAVMDSETVTRYISRQTDDFDSAVHWEQRGGVVEHGLGVVPMVPFIRQESSDDMQGTSAVADILDLSDANAKALGDAMVTSEYFAKPRRWATGLEIQEDDDGNVVDPFGERRLLQSEDPETKFGQLPAATPTGQTELIATLTQQIGALTGLPPHYLGLHGDQPASAEGTRAAETQLVARAYGEQSALSGPWCRSIERLAAISDGQGYDHGGAAAVWQPAETITPSQAADAAQKLRTIGIPLEALLSNPLDYEPHEIREIMRAADDEVARAAINNLRGLV